MAREPGPQLCRLDRGDFDLVAADQASVIFTSVFVTAFALVAAFAALALNVVLVAAAVAGHTVGEVADAFLHVLAADIGRRVFMAAVAGVGAVVVADMASGAGRVVVAVQHKVRGVVKGGRRPPGAGMALRAVAADLPVQRVSGRGVTALALTSGVLLQQAVVKAALQAVAAHTGVIAVAADAVLAGQRLVKRCAAERRGDRAA